MQQKKLEEKSALKKHSKMEYDANKLFEAGGIFLLMDVPPNTEFGIDYTCWRTGENFKVFKATTKIISCLFY